MASMALFMKVDMQTMPNPLPDTIKISTNSRFRLKYCATMTRKENKRRESQMSNAYEIIFSVALHVIPVEQSRLIPTPTPTTVLAEETGEIKNDSWREFARFLTHNWRRAGGTARRTTWTDSRGHWRGDEKLIRGDGLQIEGRLNSRHKSADDSRQPRRLSFADSDGQRRDEERDGRRERAQPACEERFMMEINLRIVDKLSSRWSHAIVVSGVLSITFHQTEAI